MVVSVMCLVCVLFHGSLYPLFFHFMKCFFLPCTELSFLQFCPTLHYVVLNLRKGAKRTNHSNNELASKRFSSWVVHWYIFFFTY